MSVENSVEVIRPLSEMPILPEDAEDATLEQRTEVRHLIEQVISHVNVSYLNLGALLYKVSEGKYYRDYGHTSFETYVEEELSFEPRKAYYLIKVFRIFVLRLQLDESVLQGIGWSKASLLTRVINEKNYEDWLDHAKTDSYRELKSRTQEALAPETGHSEEGEETDDAGVDNTPMDLDDGSDEKMIPVSFRLFPGQFDVFERALAQVEKETGSEKISYLVEVMALEYLSQHSSMQSNPLDWWIKRIEETFGCRILAAKDDESLYEACTEILDAFRQDEG